MSTRCTRGSETGENPPNDTSTFASSVLLTTVLAVAVRDGDDDDDDDDDADSVSS
jgi:hypothetical protein